MKDEMDSQREQIKAMRKNALAAQRQKDYWSEEDHEKLQIMFSEGVGISEMAVTFHRTEMAIMNQINNLKLYEKVRSPRKKNDECKCKQCNKIECEKYAETHTEK